MANKEPTVTTDPSNPQPLISNSEVRPRTRLLISSPTTTKSVSVTARVATASPAASRLDSSTDVVASMPTTDPMSAPLANSSPLALADRDTAKPRLVDTLALSSDMVLAPLADSSPLVSADRDSDIPDMAPPSVDTESRVDTVDSSLTAPPSVDTIFPTARTSPMAAMVAMVERLSPTILPMAKAMVASSLTALTDLSATDATPSTIRLRDQALSSVSMDLRPDSASRRLLSDTDPRLVTSLSVDLSSATSSSDLTFNPSALSSISLDLTSPSTRDRLRLRALRLLTTDPRSNRSMALPRLTSTALRLRLTLRAPTLTSVSRDLKPTSLSTDPRLPSTDTPSKPTSSLPRSPSSPSTSSHNITESRATLPPDLTMADTARAPGEYCDSFSLLREKTFCYVLKYSR